MEFSNLGKHCSMSICRQKDFLPFTCKLCEKTYCLDHREVKSHDCPKYNKGNMKIITCPTCLKRFKYDISILNESKNFDIHRDHIIQYKNEYKKPIPENDYEYCQVDKCKTRLFTLNKYICKKCNRKLCLKHRFEEKHHCDNLTENIIQKIINDNNNSSNQSKSNNPFEINNDLFEEYEVNDYLFGDNEEYNYNDQIILRNNQSWYKRIKNPFQKIMNLFNNYDQEFIKEIKTVILIFGLLILFYKFVYNHA